MVKNGRMVSLAHQLHLLVRRMDQYADGLLAEHGLTYRRFLTLLIVDEHPGATQRAVAERTGASEPAASRLLRSLADDGLVAMGRTPGGGNRRALQLLADVGLVSSSEDGDRKVYTLTEAGRARLAAASAAVGGSFDDLVTSLGIDGAALSRDVTRLSDALREG